MGLFPLAFDEIKSDFCPMVQRGKLPARFPPGKITDTWFKGLPRTHSPGVFTLETAPLCYTSILVLVQFAHLSMRLSALNTTPTGIFCILNRKMIQSFIAAFKENALQPLFIILSHFSRSEAFTNLNKEAKLSGLIRLFNDFNLLHLFSHLPLTLAFIPLPFPPHPSTSYLKSCQSALPHCQFSLSG